MPQKLPSFKKGHYNSVLPLLQEPRPKPVFSNPPVGKCLLAKVATSAKDRLNPVCIRPLVSIMSGNHFECRGIIESVIGVSPFLVPLNCGMLTNYYYRFHSFLSMGGLFHVFQVLLKWRLISFQITKFLLKGKIALSIL